MEQLKSILEYAGVDFKSLSMPGGGYEKRITLLRETEKFIACVVNHASFHENTDSVFVVSKDGREILIHVRDKNQIINVERFEEENGKYLNLTFSSAPNSERSKKIKKSFKFEISKEKVTKLNLV